MPTPRPAVEFFAHTSVGRRGVLASGGALLAALLVWGCETSSTVSTGPNPVKCVVSLGATPMMEAVGGSSSLTITTQPECAWDASTNVSWISGLAPTTGQGTADVSFRVAANEGSSTRDGMIVVNGEQARVSQRAPCRYEIGPANQNVAVVGGAGSITVTTASECSWTATVEVGWIALTSSATGTGSGRVSFSVAPNESAARSGTIAIANQRPTVTQAGVSVPAPPAPPAPPPACNTTISPTSQNVGAAGGAGTTVTVTAGSTCQWTAASNASWITVTSGGTTRAGNGSVTFSVAANNGAERTGTLTIAGHGFTVTQAAGSNPQPPTPPPPTPPPTPPPPQPPAACSYSVSPTSLKLGRGGSTASISVSTASTCSWTASSNTSWITVTSGTSGTGSGTMTFSFTRNDGRNDRTGSLTVAGSTVSIEQNGGGGNNDE